MSTHIIEEAKDVFDEVIFMKQGKLLLKEKTEDLLERCVHVSGRAEAVEKPYLEWKSMERKALGGPWE